MTWIFFGWMISRLFVLGMDPVSSDPTSGGWTREWQPQQINDGSGGQPPQINDGSGGQPPKIMDGSGGQPPARF